LNSNFLPLFQIITEPEHFCSLPTDLLGRDVHCDKKVFEEPSLFFDILIFMPCHEKMMMLYGRFLGAISHSFLFEMFIFDPTFVW